MNLLNTHLQKISFQFFRVWGLCFQVASLWIPFAIILSTGNLQGGHCGRYYHVHRKFTKLGKGAQKKGKKLTNVSFTYVCVAENGEMLVFFPFFSNNSLNRQLSFRVEVLNHMGWYLGLGAVIALPPPLPVFFFCIFAHFLNFLCVLGEIN